MRFGAHMRKLLVMAIAFVATAAFASDITRSSVVAEMNVRRVAAGLPQLHEDVRLDQAADDRVTDMEDEGYWSHVSPEGREPFVWLQPHGYDYQYAGENLASGFDTVEVLVDAWMESKGHRANILSPIYQDCGVAIVEGSTTRRASGKSIVVMFGRQRTPTVAASEPSSTDRSRGTRQ
ncbi:MAG TPA: CAP domain-containing protein [Thermoanaerobaculia bacterium]|nr:CAP domain-containing protein [Thermoanaerobaculia bacterium]